MANRNALLFRLEAQSVGLVLTLLLALPSTPARAAFQGVAGEALLIPFVLFDSAYGINTIVEITVPDQVGVAAIPNQFTAQHTSPAQEPLGGSSELTLIWSFFDSQGRVRLQDDLTTHPNTLVTFNWHSQVSRFAPHLVGELGYLVVQTEKGAEGGKAGFNLFGHARLRFSDRWARIPVIALSDGPDDAQANGVPTLENEVVGSTIHSPPLPSPLAAGISTGSVDDGPDAFTAFDLAAGKTFWTLMYNDFPYSSYWRRVAEPTLLVVWNDRNNPDWNPVASFFFDTNANYCSFPLTLNKPLNVYWVSPPGVPSFGPSYIDTITPCSPSGSWFSSPAYVHVVLPRLQQDAASVAFSIVFADDQANMTIARERGRFETP